MMTRTVVLILLFAALCATPLRAAQQLTGATVAAFDRYVKVTEARLSQPGFLWIDSLPDATRRERLRDLRSGKHVIAQMKTLDEGRNIAVPDGLIHHWLGIVFVKGSTLDEAVGLLQDYNRHAAIYAPNIARSVLRGRDRDRFDFHLRFRMTKVITVVINSEHRAEFTREGPDRVSSRIRSTRVAQVESPDEAQERELPIGADDGYLWRLNSYWRFLAADGGIYIQTESVSLTRPVPWYLTPVRSLVTDLPRETLEFTLETTRRQLQTRVTE